MATDGQKWRNVKNLAPDRKPEPSTVVHGVHDNPNRQMMLPDDSADNAPRTVGRRPFAILALKAHKSFALKALPQGAATPEVNQNRAF